MLAHITAIAALAAGASASPLSFVPRDATTDGVIDFVEPAGRGWNNDAATQGPCGGVPFTNYTFWGTSADFYLNAANDVSNIRLSYSKSTDMSNPISIGTIASATAGYICLDDPMDVREDLGMWFGDKITLQIAFHDDKSHKDMYTCADLSFTSNHAYEPEIDFTCSNTSFIRTEKETATKKQKVSPLAAGWIGAGATIAFVLALLALLKWRGYLFFSRSSKNRANSRAGASQFDSTDDISLNASSIQKQPI